MDFSAQFFRSMKLLANPRPRPMRRRRASAHGFSLVEILVVVGIMALLVALVGPSAMRMFEGSKDKTNKIQSEQLRSALDIFVLDVGRYPTDIEGLNALVENPGNLPGWNGPYLRDGMLPKDPWGQPYRYMIVDGVVRVVSSVEGGRQAQRDVDVGVSN
jgi:general secretion pathway protein G